MKHIHLVALFIVLVVNTHSITSYRILGLFPHPGLSHFNFFHPLLRGLAEAGHDVTVVSYFPDKDSPSNYTDYPLEGAPTLSNSVDMKKFEINNILTSLIGIYILFSYGIMACEKALESSAIQRVLEQKEPYDVVLVEHFNTECMMGVTYRLKAPVIAISSSSILPHYYKVNGVPYDPLQTMYNWFGVENRLGLIERLSLWITQHTINVMFNVIGRNPTNELVRKHLGKSIPDVYELSKNIELAFVNQHFSISGVKPLPQNVIELGGIHIKEQKPLEPEIKQVLDNAKNGVIYISFGSQVRAESLPEYKREAIVQAVSRFDQQIVWKWENDTIPNRPVNLYTRKWMPQRDILCHPNIKVFVTHGGLMGLSEAVYCGVPMVIVPMFGDQFANAVGLQEREIATIVKYKDITEENLYNAIKETLNPKYLEKAKIVSEAYRNRPQKPLETGIWWVEQVAKTKGETLVKSKVSNVPWYVYESLDLYVLLVVIAVSWNIFLVFLIKCTWTRVTRNKTKSVKITSKQKKN